MSKQTNDSTRNRFLSTEFLGEVLLLAFVGWFFFYMLWESQDWGKGAWLMPRIVVLGGLPFWFLRVILLFKTQIQNVDGTSQIMDMGFLQTDASPQVVRMRWIQLLGTTTGLLVGLVVFGYHIGIPLYVSLYLFIWGKVKWWLIAGAIVFYELVIVVVYDNILLSEWNTPLVQPFYDSVCEWFTWLPFYNSCNAWIWAL